MINTQQIKEAARRINKHTLRTPLIRSNWLSDHCKGGVWLKLESEQYTGSFKARGALNKLLWLREKKTEAMPVTASTGNHGLGFARALQLLDMKGKVYLPRNAVESKIEAIKSYNTEIEFYGDDPYTTELYARKTAEEKGWVYVSPYNDEQIIAGQGTIGKEIISDIDQPDNILATVGGGGLISGVGAYVKEVSPGTKIIGCQPENSPEMSVSVRVGEYKEVESKPTLSDGSAGGFERNAITFEMCKKLVDDFVLISESQIKQGIQLMIKKHSKLIEGAAAVAVAPIIKHPEKFSNQTSVVVICGANISFGKLREVLNWNR